MKKGIPILSEIELAFRFIHVPIIAVTGTNGKTTTTLLIGEMLKEDGRKVGVGGNVGEPLILFADEKRGWEVLVVEISSFQLEAIETFRPRDLRPSEYHGRSSGPLSELCRLHRGEVEDLYAIKRLRMTPFSTGMIRSL